MKRGYHRPEEALYMPRAEIAALLYCARRRAAADSNFSYFFFWLQYVLGLRVGEGVLLRYEHLGPLDPVTRWPQYVKVPTLKKKNAKLYTSCPATSLPLLPVPVLSHGNVVLAAFDRRYRPKKLQRSPWIFPSAHSSGHVSRSLAIQTFNSLLGDAGLPDHYSTHSLRHSAGTNLYERTKRKLMVTRFLRHSDGRDEDTNRRTVTDRYIHLTPMAWSVARGALDLPPLAPLTADRFRW